jgi:cytochrome c2
MRSLKSLPVVLAMGLMVAACGEEQAEKKETAPATETTQTQTQETKTASAPAQSEEKMADSTMSEDKDLDMTPKEAVENMKRDAGKVADKAEELAGKATDAAKSAAASVSAAMSGGDAASGENIFKKCKACHSAEEGGKNKVGPNLFGVVGRQAGTVADFRYSKAMEAFDKEWSVALITEYLADPNDFLKAQTGDSKARSKMTFKLRDEQDRKDVTAYLATLQ